MARARSVDIYLKPGFDEDDRIYAVWLAIRGRARPQAVFRRALLHGLRAMARLGDLPDEAALLLETGRIARLPPPARRPGRPQPARPAKTQAGPPEAAPRPEAGGAPRSGESGETDGAPPAADEPKRRLGRLM